MRARLRVLVCDTAGGDGFAVLAAFEQRERSAEATSAAAAAGSARAGAVTEGQQGASGPGGFDPSSSPIAFLFPGQARAGRRPRGHRGEGEGGMAAWRVGSHLPWQSLSRAF